MIWMVKHSVISVIPFVSWSMPHVHYRTFEHRYCLHWCNICFIEKSWKKSRWWFQIFFKIFTPSWGRFKGVTNHQFEKDAPIERQDIVVFLQVPEPQWGVLRPLPSFWRFSAPGLQNQRRVSKTYGLFWWQNLLIYDLFVGIEDKTQVVWNSILPKVIIWGLLYIYIEIIILYRLLCLYDKSYMIYIHGKVSFKLMEQSLDFLDCRPDLWLNSFPSDLENWSWKWWELLFVQFLLKLCNVYTGIWDDDWW